MDFDVVIVGGGVLGLSLAYHLGTNGQRALVIEREMLPGVHASGRNAGMFRQLYRHPKLTEWALRSARLWPEELRENCFRETGSCIAGRRLPDHHQDHFEERIISVVRKGRKKSVPSIYTRADGLLDSPVYMNNLFQLAKDNGTEFRFREEVFRVEFHDSKWHVETIQGDTFSGTWLVNASGAWLNHVIAESLNTTALDVQPFARHLFVVGGFPANYMPEEDCGFFWDEEEGWYLRLWDRDSRLVSLGDRSPATPETFVPDPNLHERVSQVLLEALPDVGASLHIARSWHCFRTYAEDQLPVVGEDPEHKQLFWLGGFGGFGMSTSFGACQDVAALIGGNASEIPVEFSALRTRLNKDKLAQSTNTR